jgi:hypothetical protein
MKGIEMKRYETYAWAAVICLLVVLSFWTGASMQKVQDIQEYEQGFKDGWKDALHGRPVSEELEMVCLGLWTASLVERKR